MSISSSPTMSKTLAMNALDTAGKLQDSNRLICAWTGMVRVCGFASGSTKSTRMRLRGNVFNVRPRMAMRTLASPSALYPDMTGSRRLARNPGGPAISMAPAYVGPCRFAVTEVLKGGPFEPIEAVVHENSLHSEGTMNYSFCVSFGTLLCKARCS